MESNLKMAKEVLKKYNQTHVIPFLEDGKNIELINEILNTDFNNLSCLYNKVEKAENIQVKELEPILSINPNKLQKEEITEYENIGIDIIKKNKFAVCTMAGRTGNKIAGILEQKEHIS